MTDLETVVVLVAIPILIFVVPLNAFVAWETAKQAWRKPSIVSLNLAVLSRTTRLLASLAFAVLGAASIYFIRTDTRLLPPPIPLLLILFGALIISAPSPFDIKAIRKWKRELEALRAHNAAVADLPHPHRRRDDPPPGTDL